MTSPAIETSDWHLASSRFGLQRLMLPVYLGVSLLTRLAFAALSWDHVRGHRGELVLAFLVGLLEDLISFAWIALPLSLYLALAPQRLLRSRPHRLLVGALLFLTAAGLAFDAASEWFFWDEFSSRFNFIAVDYLVYTQEVLDNINESYPLPWIVAGDLVVAGLVVWALRRPLRSAYSAPLRSKNRFRVPLILGAFLAVSWFGHLSQLNFSSNRYVNEVGKNGLVSLFSAFLNNKLEYDAFYSTLPAETAVEVVRASEERPGATYLADDPLSLQRHFAAAAPERDLNLVFITVESLSSSFVGLYGSEEGLTPRLDELGAQGQVWTRLFATGSRTVRGLEALALSIPPTPGRSIVKRPGCEDLFGPGWILKDAGYDVTFAYGGYGYFDNMNHFFGSNGFEILDRSVIPEEETTFTNAWGVCDEDLFDAVLKECDASHAASRPFFTQVMTTSNHRPFTYPDVIDIPPGHRPGAVKYTDHAIGRFIDMAREREWFANTIFAIVADHCHGSAGERELDLAKQHIPLILYAPGLIEPSRVDTLASQVDIFPTLLAMMGQEYDAPFYGSDLLHGGGGRAFVGNYQSLGYYDGETLTILKPKRENVQYSVGPAPEYELTPIEPDPDSVRKTIAYYQSATNLFDSPAMRRHAAASQP